MNVQFNIKGEVHKQRSRPKKIVDYHIPQYENKQVALLKQITTDQTITWIGHSTFLIQKEGLNLLTDPVWANRMGVANRLTNPGLSIDEISY